MPSRAFGYVLLRRDFPKARVPAYVGVTTRPVEERWQDDDHRRLRAELGWLIDYERAIVRQFGSLEEALEFERTVIARCVAEGVPLANVEGNTPENWLGNHLPAQRWN